MLSLDIARIKAIEHFKSDLIEIDEDKTRDFQWGVVFQFIPAKYEKTGNIGGVPHLLVDKFNGNVIPIDYQKNMDIQLEEYRERNGYDHVIKFKLEEDLQKMATVQKVFSLMRTEEIVQIEQAINMITEKQLFSVRGLAEVCTRKIVECNFEIHISNNINLDLECYSLIQSDLLKIPKEIALFHSEIRQIEVYDSKLECFDESLLALKNVTSISVESSPLRELPSDLTALQKLKLVRIKNTKISTELLQKIILPKNCELRLD